MLIVTQGGGSVVNLDRFDRVYYEEIGLDFEKGLTKANYEVKALRADSIESFDSSTTQRSEITLGRYYDAETAKEEIADIAIAAEYGKRVYYMSDKD